jgi:hypothetical protein
MKTHQTAAIFLGLAVLAGCSQSIWYREGADPAKIAQAQDQCALQADTQAPYRPETRIVPGPIIPAQRICDPSGACTVIPAHQGFPDFETVDANADRRALLARDCMAKSGFTRVSLPNCSAERKSSVTPGITRSQPKLTEQSCVIPRGPAGYQIVP